jgi:hypothetical protein
VLEVARRRGMIDGRAAASVRDWMSEPRGWALRHGFA